MKHFSIGILRIIVLAILSPLIFVLMFVDIVMLCGSEVVSKPLFVKFTQKILFL